MRITLFSSRYQRHGESMKITASIHGQIQGDIWMPFTTCTKSFSVGERDFNYSDGSRPSLRDMVLHVCNDGDFQSANVSFGYLKLEMLIKRADGHGFTRKVREFDLRLFPSIADSIVSEDDVVYANGEVY